jgi:hypothetical protein
LADHKHDEAFKVIDRRLFTAEGELRKEAVEEEARRETETARKIGASNAASSNPGSAAQATAPAQAPAAPQAKSADAPKPSRNFQMLVDFMARNAALLMGGYADPRTGQAILDLEGAREFIDMLDTLEEKTRGNLAEEDKKLLLDVIGSLKISYVEMSKAAAEAMKEKAKSHS